MIDGIAAHRPLRWLYLDLNAYFASVHQQIRPELRGRAVAVGPRDIDSGTVIAASYEAKAFGIRTGMKVGEAKRRCPDLVFAGGSHAVYVRFHKQILAEIERHVPVTMVCSIDEVACRLLDNESKPQHAQALARRIKKGIAENVGRCLTSSIGIAPSRLVAKIASDMEKPDGLVTIEAHELPARLFGLKLADIPGIGPRMEARLAANGVNSIERLLSAAPARADGMWGSVVGSRMWWALHGHDLPEQPRKSRSIGHSHVLAPQMRDIATVRQTARRLLAKAAARLRKAESVAAHLTLHVRFEDRGGVAIANRLTATDDSFALLSALEDCWRRFLPQAADRRVHTVGVSLDGIGPARGQQLSLFERHADTSRNLAVAQAMDRLNERFGQDSVMLGAMQQKRRIGGHIAFGHIPDEESFDGAAGAGNPRR